MNPFKITDDLIDRKYRIPIFRDFDPRELGNDWVPSTYQNNTIELHELLQTIKDQYLKLQNENAELKKDFDEVVNSGAIRMFVDGYYNNMKSVEKASEIARKWGFYK